MDKYEFNIKVEQIRKLSNQGDFETATTFILKMRIPYGILDGSHPRHQLRIIHVVTDLDIQ